MQGNEELPRSRVARTDVHRHVLPEHLCAALARRTAPPRLRREHGTWLLEVADEAAAPAGAVPEALDAQVAELAREGLDRGVLALSAALGVETLAPDEARALIAAWHADTAALPGALRAWGAAALADPRPQDADAALAAGRVGLCLPATALAKPTAVERLGPLLARVEALGGVLFVHPGPAAPGDWLPAVTAYTASLTAAWLAWAVAGRPAHPRLRVLFAALAGLAPLQAERVASRVDRALAAAALADARTFYDCSSYGPVAAAQVQAVAGAGQVVYGSDRPWATGAPDALPDGVVGRHAEALFAGVLGWADGAAAVA